MRSDFALTALGVLALAPGCSGGAESAPDGAELFRTQACFTCHGPDRQGTGLGPPLKDIARHWTADEIARYLEDPPSYAARDARLAELAARFPQPMPPYGLLGREERAALARWLLAD